MNWLSRVARFSMLCIFSLWLSYTTAHAIPIADSVSEFSGVQGQDNWYYGFYESVYTANFYYLVFDTSINRWRTNSYPPWYTLLWDTGGHPGAYTPVVRRWVSEVSGWITISGILRDEDPGGGNGVIGKIIVDGTEVWSQLVDGFTGHASVDYSISVPVSTGSIIDFVIHPNGYNSYDTTTFTATIETSSAPVPEPSTLLLLGSGLFGLAGLRRFKRKTR